MKMARLVSITLLALVLVAIPLQAQGLEMPRVSPKAVVTQTIGTTTVTVTYCRPGVKERAIWGGLVPYNEVWRTGANEATLLTISDPVKVEGQELAAGTYALATIPGADEWTFIVNKNTAMWGTMGYKQEEDILRVKVKPVAVAQTEWMQFMFTDLKEDSAILMLQWEKVGVPVKFSVDTMGKFLNQARKTMARYWTEPYRAAMFCLDHDTGLDEALKWINTSVAIQETFYNLAVKARILARQGQKAEAVAIMEKALAVGRKMEQPPFNLKEMEGLLAEWKK
ncbi:MAG TPA: DUF2911 domain-containing protein [Acidobacteriota bacterium]|nr:DUF2911 domain-containing protein [Acidobacteriota bacterium]HQM62031.1 DUF2911 domain-containing protein [Acidobacteriota bacterium]